MLRIHVRLNLEDETTEFFFFCFYDTGFCFSTFRLGRPLYEIFEHFLNTEIS